MRYLNTESGHQTRSFSSRTASPINDGWILKAASGLIQGNCIFNFVFSTPGNRSHASQFTASAGQPWLDIG
jgi:hypothetical protein